jgi:TBC1 domain family member 5
LEKRWKQGSLTTAGAAPLDLNEDDISTLMSITALKHIRDVLLGTAKEYNPDILPSAPSPVSQAPPPVASFSQDMPSTPATSLPRVPIVPKVNPGETTAPISPIPTNGRMNYARNASTIASPPMSAASTTTSRSSIPSAILCK